MTGTSGTDKIREIEIKSDYLKYRKVKTKRQSGETGTIIRDTLKMKPQYIIDIKQSDHRDVIKVIKEIFPKLFSIRIIKGHRHI